MIQMFKFPVLGNIEVPSRNLFELCLKFLPLSLPSNDQLSQSYL